MMWCLSKLVSLCPGGQELIKMVSRSINERVYIIKVSIWMGIGLLIYSENFAGFNFELRFSYICLFYFFKGKFKKWVQKYFRPICQQQEKYYKILNMHFWQ